MENYNCFKHFYPLSVNSETFAVSRIGVRETMHPGIINRPAGTGDSLLMFFYDEAIVNTENGLLTVPPGSLIYWEKCGHYYGNTAIPWMHSWVHFDGSEAIKIVRRAGMRPFLVTSMSSSLIEEALTVIDCEMSRIKPDMVIVRDRFEIFIRELMRSIKPAKNEVQIPERLLAIKDYLEANCHRRLKLDKLAQRFSISRPHLSAEFKRFFGTSPIEYLIERRLQEAEILLTDHNLRIGAVAEMVGWDDVCHFSKIFKKRRGRTPSSIRRGM
ncbi:MAG: AraC family transcriptional regulator [Victivallaceae bacterium]|nr:AraC family transcriptional regulator [Victivallaceae bacterium]